MATVQRVLCSLWLCFFNLSFSVVSGHSATCKVLGKAYDIREN